MGGPVRKQKSNSIGETDYWVFKSNLAQEVPEQIQ